MNLCEPDLRWKKVVTAMQNDSVPDDDLCVYVCRVLRHEVEDRVIQLAVSNIQDPEYRDHLVAFILSGAPQETIQKVLNINGGVLTAFTDLYMDVQVFCHKMEKRRYANYYVNNVCQTDAAEDLIKKGVIEGSAGLELFWNSPTENLSLDSHEMYRSLVEMAYIKALTIRHSDLTADVTKEGLKWVNGAVKALTASQTASFKDTTEDLGALVAIENHDYTHTAEEMGLNPADILH